MKIGCVIPTIPGREIVLERTLAAYETTTPTGYELDLVIPEGYETVGEAWNAGAAELDTEYLHFGIDDAEPHAGWLEAALASPGLPCARIVWPSGELECCGSMGCGGWLPECPDETPCRSTGIPFVSRVAWEDVGVFAPIHFYVDDDWYWRAELRGYTPVVCRGYAFTHHYIRHQATIDRAGADRAVFLSRAAEGVPA